MNLVTYITISYNCIVNNHSRLREAKYTIVPVLPNHKICNL